MINLNLQIRQLQSSINLGNDVWINRIVSQRQPFDFSESGGGGGGFRSSSGSGGGSSSGSGSSIRSTLVRHISPVSLGLV